MERRTYDKEFKAEAVRLSQEEGRTVVGVAQALGIRPELLYRWRAEWKANGANAFPGQGHLKAEDAEVRRLERELAQVRMERDILKKALRVFAQPSS
jgi:transposase